MTSPALLEQLDEKLRLKFAATEGDSQLIRARLEKSAKVVLPDIRLAVIDDDPDDDRVLECAVTGKVDYVVSGDRHLLKLGSYAGIPIRSVRQFMDAIEAGF